MTNTCNKQREPIPSCGRCTLVDEVAQLRQEVAALTDLVHTDPLTGIPNLRHFLQALEQELERTRRSGQSTCLVMLDLDHFKQVNDTHGHEIGNRALVQISRIMVETLRRIDIPCRYGGEEFAIILTHTDLPAGIRVAERLRKAIAAKPLPLDNGTSLGLTASLGIAMYQSGDITSVPALIQQADSYLYQAKDEGRNRTCHPPLPAPETDDAVAPEEKSALFGWTRPEETKTPAPRKRRRKSRSRTS